MYTSIMVKSETNILIAITIVFLLEFAFEGDNSLLFGSSDISSDATVMQGIES